MNSALVKLFPAQPAGPGRAWVCKDRLAYADRGSTLLGVDEGKVCATFVISTDDPDRVDDVVSTKGIYLANFKANPIAFYGHQILPLPVGKWAERDSDRCTIRLEEHRAIGTCYFSQRSREAEQVFALVAEGILRATSIGFNPMEEPVPRDGRKANPISLQRGFVFPKVDLLEVSIVGIPAQPTATLVREVLSRNKLAGWPMVPAIRKSLRLLAEPAPVWSHGATLKNEIREVEIPMSKKKPTTESLPCGCIKKLLALIPPEYKSAVEDCVQRKIPKIAEDHPEMSEDQRVAVAYSMCGEDKDLSGSSGTAGGYTVPEDEEKARGKKATAKASSALAGPPPDAGNKPGKRNGNGNGDDGDGDGQPEPEQVGGNGQGDPKEVLSRLVDALTAYLDLTAQKPAPPPDEEEDDEEDDEEDNYDDDMNDGGKDREGEVGDDRYEFRSRRPRRIKRGKYHSASMMKKVKGVCKAASLHCKELSEMDDGDKFGNVHKSACAHHHKALDAVVKDLEEATKPDGDEDDSRPQSPPPGEANEPQELPHETKGDDLDVAMILRELQPVKGRVTAVGNAWDAMNGRMP